MTDPADLAYNQWSTVSSNGHVSYACGACGAEYADYMDARLCCTGYPDDPTK